MDKAQPGQAKPAAQPSTAPQPQPAAAPAQVKSLAQLGIPDGSYDLVPLDGMRKTIARRMTESFRDIPHFPLTIDLEIDRLLDARGRINGSLHAQGIKVSVNDLIIKAAAAALKKVPEANASYSPEGLAMHHHGRHRHGRGHRRRPESRPSSRRRDQDAQRNRHRVQGPGGAGRGTRS